MYGRASSVVRYGVIVVVQIPQLNIWGINAGNSSFLFSVIED